MNMILRKKILLGFCVLTFVAFATACTQNTKTETTSPDTVSTDKKDTAENASDSSDVKAQDAASIIYGKVTGVDGNNISLALGEMSGRNMKGGTMPSGSPQEGKKHGPGDGAQPSGGPENRPKNEGADPSGAPQNGDGNKKHQDGMPKRMSGTFTENGETSTITITDESIIKVQSKGEQSSGSLENITVGSLVAVEYAKDGSITSILVDGTNKTASEDSGAQAE